MAALLRLANIEKSYDITKTQKQVVLKGVTASFDRGEFVALVGESGCGKSTLINIMGGLDTEYTGSVIVKDAFLRDYTEKQMDDYRKKRVGMVFQDYNLIHHLTILENVEIAMQMSDIPSPERKAHAMDLLRMVGLDQYASKHPSQLSGGQQQRVAIARALANNPAILLADEPTGALDKESQEIVLAILKKIVETGKLVIVVTHSALVASHCSRIVRIDDGVVASDERKYEIKIQGEYEKTIKPKPIRFKEIAKLSAANLIKKMSRTLLVSIGLAIGIAAVVLILNLSLGLTSYVKEVYVDNLQSVQLAVTQKSGDSFEGDEFSEIVRLDGVSHAYASTILEDAGYTYGETSGTVVSTSAFYKYYYPVLSYGELPEEDDEILVNEAFAASLGGTAMIAILDTELTIDFDGTSVTYVITGIYQDCTDDNESANVLLTEDALAGLYDVEDDSTTIYVTAADVTYVSSVIDELEGLGYTVRQEDNSANSLLEYIDLGTKVLTGVSAISMIVAAIMIFIVMYISIVERTKEIGILRAIGARKKDISRMFMCEAGMIGVAGGVLAVVFTLVITLATNGITEISIQTTLIGYSVPYYLLGLVLSFAVSVIAGIAPAVKAAELDPVVALRFE